MIKFMASRAFRNRNPFNYVSVPSSSFFSAKDLQRNLAGVAFSGELKSRLDCRQFGPHPRRLFWQFPSWWVFGLLLAGRQWWRYNGPPNGNCSIISFGQLKPFQNGPPERKYPRMPLRDEKNGGLKSGWGWKHFGKTIGACFLRKYCQK